MTLDSVFLSKLTKTLEVEPLCIVVIGLSADATKEMLYLRLSGLEGTEATRAAWSVLVWQHRFSWVQAEQTDGEGLPDNDDNGAWRFRVGRTCFAAQRASRPDRKVTYGLEFPLPRILSAMLLDVDGHPSDLLAASLRREELTKLSKRKAMSRADHLVGRCVMDAGGHDLACVGQVVQYVWDSQKSRQAGERKTTARPPSSLRFLPFLSQQRAGQNTDTGAEATSCTPERALSDRAQIIECCAHQRLKFTHN